MSPCVACTPSSLKIKCKLLRNGLYSCCAAGQFIYLCIQNYLCNCLELGNQIHLFGFFLLRRRCYFLPSSPTNTCDNLTQLSFRILRCTYQLCDAFLWCFLGRISHFLLLFYHYHKRGKNTNAQIYIFISTDCFFNLGFH